MSVPGQYISPLDSPTILRPFSRALIASENLQKRSVLWYSSEYIYRTMHVTRPRECQINHETKTHELCSTTDWPILAKMNSPKPIIRQSKIHSFKRSKYILKCSFCRFQFLKNINSALIRIQNNKRSNLMIINHVFAQCICSPCVRRDLLTQFHTHTKQSHISCHHTLKTRNDITQKDKAKQNIEIQSILLKWKYFWDWKNNF
jgi:hypothetical protein